MFKSAKGSHTRACLLGGMRNDQKVSFLRIYILVLHLTSILDPKSQWTNDVFQKFLHHAVHRLFGRLHLACNCQEIYKSR